MNTKHLNNAELSSLISGGLCAESTDDLLDLIDDLVERLDQAAVDNQDAIDDISGALDEFTAAYATVSTDIDTELTDEYNDELTTLKTKIQDYL